MRIQAIALGFLLLVGRGATPVRAQTPDTLEREGSDWGLGASVGLPGYGTETAVQLFTLGFQATHLRRLALPIALEPNVLFVPSAGFSAIGVASGQGGGGTVGLNAGVAAMIFGAGSTGLRTGVTWHQFGEWVQERPQTKKLVVVAALSAAPSGV